MASCSVFEGFNFMMSLLQKSPAVCDDDSPSNFARFSNIFYLIILKLNLLYVIPSSSMYLKL